jgi:hypothetical protein
MLGIVGALAGRPDQDGALDLGFDGDELGGHEGLGVTWSSGMYRVRGTSVTLSR